MFFVYLGSAFRLLQTAFKRCGATFTCSLEVKVNLLLVALVCCCSNWQFWCRYQEGLCFTDERKRHRAQLDVAVVTVNER